jgi:hypothetical protein
MTGTYGSSPTGRRSTLRRILTAVAVIIVVLPVAAAAYWAAACPCEGVPGLYLRGTEVTEPVIDWSFANQVRLCQIQVDTGLLPQANNLNCMATDTGELYLSCGGCAEKRWSNAAVENNEGWVRLDANVYPVTLRRVTDAAERERAWDARTQKLSNLDDPPNTPPPAGSSPDDDWWTFHVVSR